MKATILDTKTGDTAISDEGFTPFTWAFGNWCCDCNRQDYFPNAEEIEGCQSQRFLVISAEYTEAERENGEVYTFDELNADYPLEIRTRFSPPRLK